MIRAPAVGRILTLPGRTDERVFGMTRILIADDHDVVRRGLRAILESRPGWTVVAEASDGRQAIDQALQTRPDVAIIDYGLPLLNGSEVTRQIRERLPKTEVLVFTMHDSDAVLQEVLQAGARGFLLKSDADDYLVAAVHAISLRKPFFTGQVSQKMLDMFLAKSGDAPVLTARERSVVKLIAEGRTNREMADVLSLSAKTIESHRAAALRKLNLATTADLIRYAVRNNLVDH
jgi:DNA-binding NarL/FixJ family response regulator